MFRMLMSMLVVVLLSMSDVAGKGGRSHHKGSSSKAKNSAISYDAGGGGGNRNPGYSLLDGGKEAVGGANDNLRLHADMFDPERYNVKVRPALDYGIPTKVHVQVFLHSLISLNMPEEYLHLTGFIKVAWTDDQLKWNSSEYGGIDSMLVTQDEVWRPDLVFGDSRHEEGEIYMGSEHTKCEITSDGLVRWAPSFNMKFSCKVDSTRYPFDEDFCSMKIHQYMDDTSSVMLIADHMDMSHMMTSGTFFITYHDFKVLTEVYSNRSYDTLEFEMKLIRRPQFAVMSLLLPLMLISLLCVVPYLFKPDNSDKFATASSLLLSFTVFLEVLHDNLPENSENIGILALYVSAMISLAFMASLGNGLVFAYHCLQEDSQPETDEDSDEKETSFMPEGEPLNGGQPDSDTESGGKRSGVTWPWFFKIRGQAGPVVLNNVCLFIHVALFMISNIWMFAILLSSHDHAEEMPE